METCFSNDICRAIKVFQYKAWVGRCECSPFTPYSRDPTGPSLYGLKSAVPTTLSVQCARLKAHLHTIILKFIAIGKENAMVKVFPFIPS